MTKGVPIRPGLCHICTERPESTPGAPCAQCWQYAHRAFGRAKVGTKAAPRYQPDPLREYSPNYVHIDEEP